MIGNEINQLSGIRKSIIGFVIISFLIVVIICVFSNRELEQKQRKKETKSIEISNNTVFLGDSITALYDVEKYYPNINVVNSGVHADTTDGILQKIEERVFQYNPSKIFILIGTNDIQFKNSDEHIMNRYKMIIDTIKEHRPYAKIYVESIYPVNRRDDLYDNIRIASVGDRSNERITSLNKKIKKLCNKENIVYIDMFSKLVDEEGNIDIKYTKEGLHLTKEAYEMITRELTNYLEPEEQEILKREK